MDTEYSDQARRSLIMLKNICSIDFQVKMFRVAGKVMHQNTEKKWKVSSVVDGKKVESDDGNKFKQIESYTMNITIERGPFVKPEKWMVVTALIRDDVLPQKLRQFALDERHITTDRLDIVVPDVAIAAPINYENASTLFYNSLPLETKCGLPVNLHGRFAISPDRRSIRTDNTGGQWNTFLASSCLSQLYFVFLEHLALSHYSVINYYSFWPSSLFQGQ